MIRRSTPIIVVSRQSALLSLACINLLKLNLTGKNNLSERTKRVESFLIGGSVDLDDGHRFPAPLAAAEMKAADVHPALAKYSAHAADHAGDVTITHDKHVAARNCFDAK